jgi:hypothetical protein
MTSTTDTVETHSHAPRWQFTQNTNQTWQWHRSSNGDVPGSSTEFAEFGACLSDAIKHGFRPDSHKYATRSSGWQTEWSRNPGAEPTA